MLQSNCSWRTLSNLPLSTNIVMHNEGIDGPRQAGRMIFHNDLHPGNSDPTPSAPPLIPIRQSYLETVRIVCLSNFQVDYVVHEARLLVTLMWYVVGPVLQSVHRVKILAYRYRQKHVQRHFNPWNNNWRPSNTQPQYGRAYSRRKKTSRLPLPTFGGTLLMCLYLPDFLAFLLQQKWWFRYTNLLHHHSILPLL